MADFPQELLALPPPADPVERVRTRATELSRVLVPMGLAVLLGFAAVYVPLGGPKALLGRLAAGLLAVISLQILARRARRKGGWPHGLEEAAILYRAGDLSAAAAKLEALLCEELHPAYRAVAVAWRGMIALRRGDAARALRLFAEVARSGHGKERGLRVALAGVPGLTILAAAVDGDLATARRWLESMPAIDAELGRGTRLLAEVYVLVREGDLASARKRAAEHWAIAEAVLAPAELRGLRLLLAFTDPEQQGPSATRLRDGARPGWPGELDYLAHGLPAFASYLREHGFSGAAHG